MTDSEMKLTIAPARNKRASKAKTATNIAVAAAREAWRMGSPPEMGPRVAPTSNEMAEVTVIAVWRELVNNQ